MCTVKKQIRISRSAIPTNRSVQESHIRVEEANSLQKYLEFLEGTNAIFVEEAEDDLDQYLKYLEGGDQNSLNQPMTLDQNLISTAVDVENLDCHLEHLEGYRESNTELDHVGISRKLVRRNSTSVATQTE